MTLFWLFHFCFHFFSPISFTFTLQTLLGLVLYLLFYLVFVLLYLLSVLSLLLPCNLLSQKCKVKTNSFIVFFSRHIWKYVLIFLIFFRLLFFKRECFKFYLIDVLICYLYFIIYRTAQNVFGTLWSCLLGPILLPLVLNLARNEIWIVPETLCSLRWCDGVFKLSRSLVWLIFNFFRNLLFYLVYREFFNHYVMTCIRNPPSLLRLSFLKKHLSTKCPWL